MKTTQSPELFTCDGCGFTGPASSEGGTGNYGQELVTGKKFCPDCCQKRDAETIAKAERFSAYLSSDGHSITTWHGKPLMRCESCRLHRRGRFSSTYNLRAIDPQGRRWVGRGGGTGMFCNLRLAKRQA